MNCFRSLSNNQTIANPAMYREISLSGGGMSLERAQKRHPLC